MALNLSERPKNPQVVSLGDEIHRGPELLFKPQVDPHERRPNGDTHLSMGIHLEDGEGVCSCPSSVYGGSGMEGMEE